MPAIPWYQSPLFISAIVSLVFQVGAVFGYSDKLPVREDLEGLVTTVLQVIAIIAGALVPVLRAKSNIQPLSATQASADKKNQGGFIRGSLLALVAAVGLVGLPVVALLPACTGTQAAYKQAGENKAAGDYAFVIANHYTLLVEEAAELKNLPTTPPEAVAAMRAADTAASPGIERLHTAATAYDAVKNAQTQAELQAATDNAVQLVADLVRAITKARGSN